MKWTKEKPTNEYGWYWYRKPDLPYVVNTAVFKMGNMIMTPLREKLIDISLFDGEWSGPIPEPED